MKNADMPAMPCEITVAMEGAPIGCKPFRAEHATGLTKREMFAMHAMQGLLSCGMYNHLCNTPQEMISRVSISSIEIADALLSELDK